MKIFITISLTIIILNLLLLAWLSIKNTKTLGSILDTYENLFIDIIVHRISTMIDCLEYTDEEVNELLILIKDDFIEEIKKESSLYTLYKLYLKNSEYNDYEICLYIKKLIDEKNLLNTSKVESHEEDIDEEDIEEETNNTNILKEINGFYQE